jgi:Uma2 family endonuclease
MTLAESDILGQRDTYRFGDGAEPVLRAGTVGWTVCDLDDPVVRGLWEQGRFEIVDGVLTVMPPAFFRGGQVVDNLKFLLRTHFARKRIAAEFSNEVEIAVTPTRVARADGVVVWGADLQKFAALSFDPPRADWRDHTLTLPPSLVIESVSEGHEDHDEVTKRLWYANLRVPRYWIINGFARTLTCLRLTGKAYQVEASGKGNQVVRPASIPGLSIPLRKVWPSK